MEFLLGSALVNAHLVYKEVTQNRISITDFREQLCLSLLGLQDTNVNESFEEENDGQSGEHVLVETNSRLRCVVCYRNLKEKDGRKVALSKGSRSKWQCSACSKYYCIPCFFEDP